MHQTEIAGGLNETVLNDTNKTAKPTTFKGSTKIVLMDDTRLADAGHNILLKGDPIGINVPKHSSNIVM